MKTIEPVVERPEDAEPLQQTVSRKASRGVEKQQSSVLLWLGVVLVLLVSLGLHGRSYLELRELREQLVATQDSFAQVSEEATGHILSLSGQVDDLPALHARLQGMAGQLKELQRQSGQLDELAGGQQKLAGLLAQREQHAQLLEQALAGQSDAVEQAAQVLDAGRQELEQQLVRHVRQADERNLSLQADLRVLQELHESSAARMDALAGGLEALARQADQLVQEQEQLTAIRVQQQELQKEMTAFRAQVTRSQERLQQRLDGN